MASRGNQGRVRAEQWTAAAQAALDLYGPNDPAILVSDLTAEVATEVRLLKALGDELAVHAAAREDAYRRVGPRPQCGAWPRSAARP